MLKWCAYCQEFQGEISPFPDLNLTHGVCPKCKSKGFVELEDHLEHSKALKRIQERLRFAGKSGDLESAEAIIDQAIAAKVRPVDILVGLIAPLLFIIGEEWESGAICVEDEHRFTAFCEQVFDMVRARLPESEWGDLEGGGGAALLLNAYGNTHTLGIRILALWLQSKGIPSRALYPTPAPEELVRCIEHARPRAILISLATPQERRGALQIVDQVRGIPGETPLTFVGGYAVKMGLVDPIDGAELVTEIGKLTEMIQNAH
jgi:methanogenic corrinoid protein MtbC1